MASRPETAAQGTATRPGLLVLALALGVTTLSLLQSLVVPVLGTIEEQLDVSPGAAGWVLTANLLAAAVLTPVLGRLGDLRGERPVILGILVAVAAGTLLAIVTTSLPLLLAGRILQGASYGLFPLSISVLRRELPEARLSVAMSVVSSTLAVGGVVGLVATGLLVGDGGDYRRPFWIGLGGHPALAGPGRRRAAATAVQRLRPGRLVGRRRPRAPGWFSCCCRSRRETSGAGGRRRSWAAWPGRRWCSPAGWCSSGGRRSRWCVPGCSPTGGRSSPTSPG